MSDTPMEERARTVILRDLDRANVRIAELEAEVARASGGMGMETCEEQNARLRDRIAELEAALLATAHDDELETRIAELEAEKQATWDKLITERETFTILKAELEAALEVAKGLDRSRSVEAREITREFVRLQADRIAELEAALAEEIEHTQRAGRTAIREFEPEQNRLSDTAHYWMERCVMAQAERDKWSDTAGSWMERAVLAEADRDRLALSTNQDRFKTALKDIARQMTLAEHDEKHPEGGGDVEFAYDELIRIARAALSDEGIIK